MKNFIYTLLILGSFSAFADCKLEVSMDTKDEEMDTKDTLELVAREELIHKGYEVNIIEEKPSKSSHINKLRFILINDSLDRAAGLILGVRVPNGGVIMKLALAGQEELTERKMIYIGKMDRDKYASFTQKLMEKIPECKNH